MIFDAFSFAAHSAANNSDGTLNTSPLLLCPNEVNNTISPLSNRFLKFSISIFLTSPVSL